MFQRLKSLLTGIAAGTIIGVLFAPKKGSETRKMIKEDIKKGNFGVNAIKDTATGMGKDVGDTYSEISKEVSKNESLKKGINTAKDVAEKAKDKAEELYKEYVPADKRKKINETIKDAKDVLNKGVDKVKETIADLNKKKK